MMKLHVRLSAAENAATYESFDANSYNLKIDSLAGLRYHLGENELYYWTMFYSDRVSCL